MRPFPGENSVCSASVVAGTICTLQRRRAVPPRMNDSTILTFLFTDIEGSTSKWEEQPELMAQAVARHDALLRDAVTEHHGAAIVKTTGDGIYAAFARSGRRARGGRSTSSSRCSIPPRPPAWRSRVRCGLHTGAVQARDNDYFGSTINRTARIMNAAHGGQVLVSQAVADLARGSAAGRRVAEGPRQRPAEGAGDDRRRCSRSSTRSSTRTFRRCASSRRRRTTCRSSSRRSSAARRERDEIEEMLDGHAPPDAARHGRPRQDAPVAADRRQRDGRLSGRRLVHRPADDPRRFARRERDGARARRARGARAAADADALRAPQVAQADADPRQLRAGDRRDAQRSSNAILRAAPEVRILATSRIALRVPGEQTYVVQPLPVPSRTDGRRRRWCARRPCSCSSSAPSCTSRASR